MGGACSMKQKARLPPLLCNPVSIAGLICTAVGFDSHLRGPSFLLEPPPRLEFSNSSGGWLDCSASGSPPPTVDWLSVDGSPVQDVHGVRRVLLNGTLILLPFSPAAYRQDIHSTVYRCVASNEVGRIVSRDVQVRAGNSSLTRDAVWSGRNLPTIREQFLLPP